MSFLITAAATTPTYTLSLHDALPIFRRRVGGLAEARALAGGRADQNQPATAALLAELGGGRPPAGEGAAQVGADHEVEVVVGGVAQSAVAQRAGIGDHDVEPAELLDRRTHQRL